MGPERALLVHRLCSLQLGEGEWVLEGDEHKGQQLENLKCQVLSIALKGPATYPHCSYCAMQ